MIGYPAWICAPCGERLTGRELRTATFHEGDRCGWCSGETATTAPRDYGYPPAPAHLPTRAGAA